MLTTTLISLASLAAASMCAAKPSGGQNSASHKQEQQQQQACLDDNAAQKVAENFRSLITNYSNSSAAAYLSEDFHDYSDGVNTLINAGCPNGPQPLGTPTFTSLETFQAGQGSQANIPFEILNVWHGCDFVAMRWKSPNPQEEEDDDGEVPPQQEQVQGLVVLEVCQGGGQQEGEEAWVIDVVYSEFNSGAWLYDLGVFQPACDASGAPIAKTLKRALGGVVGSPVRML